MLPLPSSAARTALLSLLAGVTALALAACSADEPDSAASTGADRANGTAITVFNGATGAMTENFNPFATSPLQPTLGVIYEALFHYNLATTSDPAPLLATGFAWNGDGTELTITTRDDVRWSDGEPFTAEDVAFTFNTVAHTPELNPAGLAPTGVAIDDSHLVLTFAESSFMQEPQVLGAQAIVPEHVWRDVADPTFEINPDPVGTGAFTVESFSEDHYVLAANPTYWGGEPKVSTVRYVSLDSADDAAAAFVAGDVDWMSAYLPDLDALVADHPTLSYVNTPASTTSIFTCSSAQLGCTGPQTDKAVRQAIYWALDRGQLNASAGGGFAGEASPTLLLPQRDGAWVTDPANLLVPQGGDLERATELLEDAGWVEGGDGVRVRGGERLSLSIQAVAGWSDYIALNAAMAEQLAAIGIELVPTEVTWNEWNEDMILGTFQLSLDSIGLGASDNPYFTYGKWFDGANTAHVTESANGNSARFRHAEVDAALAAARATNDEAEQAQAYARVQEVIIDELPYIPVYVNSMLTEFSNARATGWPSEADTYAMPASWKNWDNGMVLKAIVPVG